jgi:hypothetical protein
MSHFQGGEEIDYLFLNQNFEIPYKQVKPSQQLCRLMPKVMTVALILVCRRTNISYNALQVNIILTKMFCLGERVLMRIVVTATKTGNLTTGP